MKFDPILTEVIIGQGLNKRESKVSKNVADNTIRWKQTTKNL
jgi:hypothetical protein